MDYSYAFLILLLPMLSFLILGLAGMKMSHKVAGLIGTTSLGIVTILSYISLPTAVPTGHLLPSCLTTSHG